MKKASFLFLSAILSFQAFPASAAQSRVQVGTLFSATFENKIQFKGQDCISVKFKYKGAGSLNYPAQFATLGLYKLNGNDAGGFLTFKIGDTYGLGQGGEPYTGTKSMVICQTPRTELEDPECDEEFLQTIGETCEYEEIPGVKPGKYYFSSNVTQVRPNFAVKSSPKVFVTISK